uniref:NADH-ubiquinone oxidoreductase chain 5 n=1 Tax=Platencyrtus parkeri TaxID=752748 RepID=A0A7G5WI26_9HYME|nr:NADH dehydrogenase subunit 5 [Platencyrtus parkeri]
MILFFLSGLIFLILGLIFLLFSLLMIFLKFNLFMSWSLMCLNSVSLNMIVYFDWVFFLFSFTVMLISSMIMFYCSEYMDHEKSKNRFFYLVFVFILSMILLIISPSLVSLILGWDGLGLSSYLLVIFYQNYYSFNSGTLTILMNRIGDVLLLLSMSLMFNFGSWNFMFMNFDMLILFFFLMLASFTKSAQFPFSSWLPAAMAAPTPVSSLVHSSTLVTAGIYLLIRFKNLIYLNSLILNFIIIIGLITMIIAGLSANFEFDFKKIIAYSTLSQLGLMMMIFGMKFWELSFFHLIIHAMFKSMMFMCSGIVIHSLNGYQDIRFFGNLMKFMPLTILIFMVSNFALCGMPFFSGFYSKDLILEKMFLNYFSLFMYLMLMMGTVLTLIYSLRLILYLNMNLMNFFSFSKMKDFKVMNFSLIILTLNSIFLGNFLFWLIFLNIEEVYLMCVEKISLLLIMIISLIIMLILFKNYYLSLFFLNYFLGKMFYLNYMNFFYLFSLYFMKKFYFLVDKGLISWYFEDLIVEFMKLVNFKNLNYENLIKLMYFSSWLILMNLIF